MPPAYIDLGRRFARKAADRPALRRVLRIFSQRRLLPRAVWMRLPIEGEFTVTLPAGETFRYTAIAEEGIGRGLHWRGIYGYEPETTRIFYDLARKAKTIVDIGANTGTYTLIACSANNEAQVYAFEPLPYIYERLNLNVKINQWQHRCVLHNIALADTNGILPMHIPDSSVMPVAASLKADGFRGEAGYLADVTVKTLDSICADKQIDLIKMDVEGVEDKVLLGMHRILSTSTPAIIAECFKEGPYQQIEIILRGYDYSFFHIGEHGLIRKEHIDPDADGSYQNYLFVPKHRTEEIQGL